VTQIRAGGGAGETGRRRWPLDLAVERARNATLAQLAAVKRLTKREKKKKKKKEKKKKKKQRRQRKKKQHVLANYGHQLGGLV
jgi:ABC-type Zn2+ transport system substrate-binding protein/surface adhesin